MNRAMVDLPIAIFLMTFFGDMGVGSTAENTKMRQESLRSKPHFMQSDIPTKAGVREPILEVDSSGDCFRPEFVWQIRSEQHGVGHIEESSIETFRNAIGLRGVVSRNIAINSLFDEESLEGGLIFRSAVHSDCLYLIPFRVKVQLGAFLEFFEYFENGRRFLVAKIIHE